MRIPANEIIIPRDKLTEYLLKPRLEDDKSKFLAQVGFTHDKPEILEQALRQMVQENDAVHDRTNEYGDYFHVIGDLIGIGGQSLKVVTIWIVKASSDGIYRFVMLIPWKD